MVNDNTIILERNGSFRITIELDGGNGAITSDLHLSEESIEHDSELQHVETAMCAIESLVLAHACAGLDIQSEAYLDGLETSLENLTNSLG